MDLFISFSLPPLLATTGGDPLFFLLACFQLLLLFLIIAVVSAVASAFYFGLVLWLAELAENLGNYIPFKVLKGWYFVAVVALGAIGILYINYLVTYILCEMTDVDWIGGILVFLSILCGNILTIYSGLEDDGPVTSDESTSSTDLNRSIVNVVLLSFLNNK